MPEKAMVKQEEATLPAISSEELRQFYQGQADESDVARIPLMGISQPNKPSVPAGNYWLGPDRIDLGPNPEAVFLRVNFDRALWSKFGSNHPHTGPCCWSPDRVRGFVRDAIAVFGKDVGGEGVIEQECRTCPHYNDHGWEIDEGCFSGQTWLVWLMAEEDLAQFPLRSTAISGIRGSAYGRNVLPKVIGRSIQVPRKMPWHASVTLGVTEGESARGNFLIPAFTVSREFEGAELAKYKQMALDLAGVTLDPNEPAQAGTAQDGGLDTSAAGAPVDDNLFG